VSEFHAEASQATASEGLAQGPYVTARAGFEPTTLRSTGVHCTNEPPRPTKDPHLPKDLAVIKTLISSHICGILIYQVLLLRDKSFLSSTQMPTEQT